MASSAAPAMGVVQEDDETQWPAPWQSCSPAGTRPLRASQPDSETVLVTLGFPLRIGFSVKSVIIRGPGDTMVVSRS